MFRFEAKGGASEKQKKRRKGMDAAKNTKKRKKPTKKDIAKSNYAKMTQNAKAEGVSYKDALAILTEAFGV